MDIFHTNKHTQIHTDTFKPIEMIIAASIVDEKNKQTLNCNS